MGFGDHHQIFIFLFFVNSALSILQSYFYNVLAVWVHLKEWVFIRQHYLAKQSDLIAVIQSFLFISIYAAQSSVLGLGGEWGFCTDLPKAYYLLSFELSLTPPSKKALLKWNKHHINPSPCSLNPVFLTYPDSESRINSNNFCIRNLLILPTTVEYILLTRFLWYSLVQLACYRTLFRNSCPVSQKQSALYPRNFFLI